jgi:hypothetical protein
MKITQIRFYGPARAKVCRLGLAELFLEAIECILATRIEISSDPERNLPGKIRDVLDASFSTRGEWKSSVYGGLDWVKRSCPVPAILTSLGLEIQIASRTGLVSDIARLTDALERAIIDVAMLIVPTGGFAAHLPDAPPTFAEATAIVDEEYESPDAIALIVIGVEHDVLAETPASFPMSVPRTQGRAFDHFSWAEIQASRGNEELQKEHDIGKAKALWGKAAKPCSQCSQDGENLSWVYYSSAPWTWEKRCGREGWIVVCDQCEKQADFFLTLMD